MVCHSILNTKEVLKDGDIINVDVPTIYNSYFSDASYMFLIGNVSPEMHRLGTWAPPYLPHHFSAHWPI